MANRTISERIAELEADRAALRTAISEARTGILSATMGDMSTTRQRLDMLQSEFDKVEKSLQRLYRGGRGFVINMSAGSTSDAKTTVEL